jgi:hypothetical protein
MERLFKLHVHEIPETVLLFKLVHCGHRMHDTKKVRVRITAFFSFFLFFLTRSVSEKENL